MLLQRASHVIYIDSGMYYVEMDSTFGNHFPNYSGAAILSPPSHEFLLSNNNRNRNDGSNDNFYGNSSCSTTNYIFLPFLLVAVGPCVQSKTNLLWPPFSPSPDPPLLLPSVPDHHRSAAFPRNDDLTRYDVLSSCNFYSRSVTLSLNAVSQREAVAF